MEAISTGTNRSYVAFIGLKILSPKDSKITPQHSILKYATESQYSRHFKYLQSESEFFQNGYADMESGICLLQKLNQSSDINKLLQRINERLGTQAVFVGCAETSAIRKKKILAYYRKGFNSIVYLLFFLWRRVLPKISKFTEKVFAKFNEKDKILSKAEILGRLYFAGFQVEDVREDKDLLYFSARKISEPIQNINPSYWPIIKMKRVGRHNKPIYVYKIRTMHPYSEFIQEFIRKHHGLDEGGKFKNDFRVTSWGAFLRKYWIDELPMVINLLKGQIKLIGVRPISYHYLSIYKDELRKLRYIHKPGLVPPFYADMPKTLDAIMNSEENYLHSYQASPFTTDIRYGLRIIKNILFKKARSK